MSQARGLCQRRVRTGLEDDVGVVGVPVFPVRGGRLGEVADAVAGAHDPVGDLRGDRTRIGDLLPVEDGDLAVEFRQCLLDDTQHVLVGVICGSQKQVGFGQAGKLCCTKESCELPYRLFGPLRLGLVGISQFDQDRDRLGETMRPCSGATGS